MTDDDRIEHTQSVTERVMLAQIRRLEAGNERLRADVAALRLMLGLSEIMPPRNEGAP
jgi:hypothetical protein